MIDLNLNPGTKNLRIFAALQFMLFAFLAWKVFPIPGIALVVSGLAGLFGVAFPSGIRPVYVVWMLAVYPIGFVISHIVVATVFYLVVSPMALIMRAIGRDPLERAFEPAAMTYWKERTKRTQGSDYFRQF